MIELYIGGCRSGKSTAALQRANRMGADRKLFLATCQPHDAEMRARVERHQEERDAGWETVEEPLAIAGIIRRHSRPQTVILVDCLTLWLTNLIIGQTDDTGIHQHITVLEEALCAAPGPVLLVTNEVGLGIVPDNAMSRRFRDWAGSLNQRMARCAREVVLTVAGIPVPIKSFTRANLQEDE
jgi:adenosylcobinamide kinase/adenosylcobinamide-phosphate guanylyltransferase